MCDTVKAVQNISTKMNFTRLLCDMSSMNCPLVPFMASEKSKVTTTKADASNMSYPTKSKFSCRHFSHKKK